MTGFGTVSAAGCGREALTKALGGSIPTWAEIERPDGYHRRGGARLAGLASGHDFSPWLSRGAARRMSQPSKLAVVAARMAMAEAGLEPGLELDGKPTAMVFSNALGPSAFTEKILTQIRRSGPLAVSPALFTESVANAPAAQVALACGALGANITVTQREAGALIALARAASELRRGRAGRVLVLAVDEATPLVHSVFDRYGALARAGDEDGKGDDKDDHESARPFDRRRNGFILAEGATALVLETSEVAESRKAKILARLRSAASAFDPRSPVADWAADADVLAPSLARLLKRCGETEIDAVICGASGSISGDRLEAQVLRQVWGQDPLPPLLAPKAVLGEFGGAQLAAAVLALAGESFGPTPGFSKIDPELGVRPHDGGTLEVKSVLVSSLATGGAASWAVLSR